MPPSDILLVLPARAALAAESSVTSTTKTSITSTTDADVSLPNVLTTPPPSYAALTSSSSKRTKHQMLKEEGKRPRVSAKEATFDNEEEAESSDSQSNEGIPGNTPSCS